MYLGSVVRGGEIRLGKEVKGKRKGLRSGVFAGVFLGWWFLVDIDVGFVGWGL